LATACDRALGTAPLLLVTLELNAATGGDDTRRRALIGHIGATAGLATAGSAATEAVAHVVRQGLLDAVDGRDGWDEVVANFHRWLTADPSRRCGMALLAQLVVLRQAIVDRGPSVELLRGGAHLSLLYGLWQGNQGALAEAQNWYRTAELYAGRSRDNGTRGYVAGRTASRSVYEGQSIRGTLDLAEQALGLSAAPSLAAFEAYAARVHAAALTGNLRDGRVALGRMADICDRLPADHLGRLPGPAQRLAAFGAYLHGRIGTPREAESAFEAAEPVLRSAPVLRAEARIYRARSVVRAGDAPAGVAFGLAAARTLTEPVHVVRVGVRDLLDAVPAGYRSDDLRALRDYATTAPGPWETSV
jgi:hypothetical protein